MVLPARQQRGRGSAGRASPCQGEGRGFESRRPLGTSGAGRETGARVRWSGREARQRPAKPSTRVQIPSPPRLLRERWNGPVDRPERAIGSVVERYLDTVEVTGSNPVSPTAAGPQVYRPGALRVAGAGGVSHAPRAGPTRS